MLAHDWCVGRVVGSCGWNIIPFISGDIFNILFEIWGGVMELEWVFIAVKLDGVWEVWKTGSARYLEKWDCERFRKSISALPMFPYNIRGKLDFATWTWLNTGRWFWGGGGGGRGGAVAYKQPIRCKQARSLRSINSERRCCCRHPFLVNITQHTLLLNETTFNYLTTNRILRLYRSKLKWEYFVDKY